MSLNLRLALEVAASGIDVVARLMRQAWHTPRNDPTLQFHTKKFDFSALPFHPTTICSTNKPLTPKLDETWQTEAEQQAARAVRAAADSATVAVAAIVDVDVVADVDAAVARRATRRSGSL